MRNTESKATKCPYIASSATQVGGVTVTTSFSRITDDTHPVYETCALCAPTRESEHNPCAQCPNRGHKTCCCEVV